MSPYIVRTGVRSGETVYGPGDVLPDGIGDEAMVEAGAIEFVEPEPKPVQAKRKAVK